MHHGNSYRNLFAMALLSFGAMFVLMYVMVNTFSNVLINLNQLYMAGLMTMPMILIEMWLMRDMYPNHQLNSLIILFSLIMGLLFWSGIRNQIGINNQEFLKSMIPHHAGAILMCEKASLTDPEILDLCKNIISGQQAEIDFMRNKLNSVK